MALDVMHVTRDVMIHDGIIHDASTRNVMTHDVMSLDVASHDTIVQMKAMMSLQTIDCVIFKDSR